MGRKRFLMWYNKNCTVIGGQSHVSSLLWALISSSVKHNLQIEDDIFVFVHASKIIPLKFEG
jgi:hypothetical protein